MQTNGVELDEITHDKRVIRIREVGGAFVEVCFAYIAASPLALQCSLALSCSCLANQICAR